MKVHRIITTIEVENDNHSMTTVELTDLLPTNADIPLAITNLTTNGNANDISKVYAIVDNHIFDIGSKLKDIARIIDDGIDSYDYNVVADDNSTNETNDDGIL